MFGLILLIVGLMVALFYVLFDRNHKINSEIDKFKQTELVKQMEEYRARSNKELENFKNLAAKVALEDAQVRLNQWKEDKEKLIREDAIQRSKNVVAGKISEHFVPYLPEFGWNAKDARFVGAPVDFIVFDGLSEGQLKQIIFVEVKTNASQLNQREKQIRDIINKGLVKWEEVRHMISEIVK